MGMIRDFGLRRKQPESQGGKFDFHRLKLRSRFVSFMRMEVVVSVCLWRNMQDTCTAHKLGRIGAKGVEGRGAEAEGEQNRDY